jgi:hypothetical protein
VSEVSDLLKAYEGQLSIRWDPNAAGAQRVWFVIYDPRQERRIRLRVSEFEDATRRKDHGWILCDLEPMFAEWMHTL